ncbi:MAG: hypothetical protein AB7K24_17465 [Gemmataceae bacterium]
MAILLCPQCGNAAEVQKLPTNGSAKCRRCATVFPVGRPRRFWHRLASHLAVMRSKRTLTVLAFAVGMLLLGTVSYVAARMSLSWRAQQQQHVPDETVAEADSPGHEEKTAQEEQKDEPVAESSDAKEESKELVASRDKFIEQRNALQKEQQELAALAKELKEKRARLEEEQAKLDLFMKRRNPQLTAKLEEVAGSLESYEGKLLYLDGVKIIGKSVEKLKDADRFTLSAISQNGTYYSRMPNAGLVLSTSAGIAGALPAHVNGDGLIANIRIYGEIRKWDQKGAKKPTPEVHIYRIDLFTAGGDLSKILE